MSGDGWGSDYEIRQAAVEAVAEDVAAAAHRGDSKQMADLLRNAGLNESEQNMLLNALDPRRQSLHEAAMEVRAAANRNGQLGAQSAESAASGGELYAAIYDTLKDLTGGNRPVTMADKVEAARQLGIPLEAVLSPDAGSRGATLAAYDAQLMADRAVAQRLSIDVYNLRGQAQAAGISVSAMAVRIALQRNSANSNANQAEASWLRGLDAAISKHGLRVAGDAGGITDVFDWLANNVRMMRVNGAMTVGFLGNGISVEGGFYYEPGVNPGSEYPAGDMGVYGAISPVATLFTISPEIQLTFHSDDADTFIDAEHGPDRRIEMEGAYGPGGIVTVVDGAGELHGIGLAVGLGTLSSLVKTIVLPKNLPTATMTTNQGYLHNEIQTLLAAVNLESLAHLATLIHPKSASKRFGTDKLDLR